MSSRKHHRRDSDDEHKRKHKKSKHSSDLSDEFKDSIKPISNDDYFEKATEFRLWLREEKDRYFGDLDSDDARHYFKKFVKAWNRYDLDEKYYKGINSSRLQSSDSTGYRWSFAKKLDLFEQDRIRDHVDSLTNGGKGKRRNVGASFPSSSTSSLSSRQFDQVDFEEKQERERSERRAERKTEAKRSRSRREEYLDEVAPKETGREAQLAKRRAVNAYHKRERDTDVELTDADIYGGGRGEDDFRSRLAAEKRRNEMRDQRRQQRQEQKFGPIQERLAQHKAKEDATMEMFKRMAEEQKKRGGL